ncbi:hypothetical protein KY284_022183 [Solanum tuberosum]|nr:hypothetical protein KY284_022183 [Solanum tuberosum]
MDNGASFLGSYFHSLPFIPMLNKYYSSLSPVRSPTMDAKELSPAVDAKKLEQIPAQSRSLTIDAKERPPVVATMKLKQIFNQTR